MNKFETLYTSFLHFFALLYRPGFCASGHANIRLDCGTQWK